MNDSPKQHLPQPVLERVIAYYGSHLNDETVAPGIQGKRAFFQGVIVRDNYLPDDLQKEIDARRGQTTQEEYLFDQFGFAGKYSVFR